MLQIDLSSSVPIWSQIEEGVRQLVAREVLRAGGAVPSVRELAKELRVNPATVAKAYRRLAAAGIVEVRRGEGTFVTASPPQISARDRRMSLEQAATTYAGKAITLGVDASEAVECVETTFSKMSGVT